MVRINLSLYFSLRFSFSVTEVLYCLFVVVAATCSRVLDIVARVAREIDAGRARTLAGAYLILCPCCVAWLTCGVVNDR
jgi:hypothetical protein